MRILSLQVEEFRGIRKAHINFSQHSVLVGPNGAGKSTILDALSLLFGRTQLVRELTEHDFFGSAPSEKSRFRLIVTLGGFASDKPDEHLDWFRDGRGVPKWWNTEKNTAEPQPTAQASMLCVQIGLAARFVHEELKVEQLRYFHDDDALLDPFDEDAVHTVPNRLLNEIGFFVLPVRRTWEANVSFASELFRRAVATFGGIPATTLIEERDRLRSPTKPLEDDALLKPLIDRMNEQFRQLLPDAPLFKLRLTSTDSEALLRGLVPHYGSPGGTTLPASRHGTGLLSLQTFVLLLEIGRARREKGLPFILAMEEPELHVPPGLQRKLAAEAVAISEQTICSSHAPRVAAFYPATSTIVVDRAGGDLRANPMLNSALKSTATAVQRKIYIDDRPRIVDALMHHRVLVPEGRFDADWLRRLSDAIESSDHSFGSSPQLDTPFGAVVGAVPTHSSGVKETFEALQKVHRGVVPLVDGDGEGETKLTELLQMKQPPKTLLIWKKDWEIEDAIVWILGADEFTVVGELSTRLALPLTSLADLLARFKIKEGAGRMKDNPLAHDEIASVIRGNDKCRARASLILSAVTNGALGSFDACPALSKDPRSTSDSTIFRIDP